MKLWFFVPEYINSPNSNEKKTIDLLDNKQFLIRSINLLPQKLKISNLSILKIVNFLLMKMPQIPSR